VVCALSPQTRSTTVTSNPLHFFALGLLGEIRGRGVGWGRNWGPLELSACSSTSMLREAASTAFEVVITFASKCCPGYCGSSKLAFIPGRS
jgi:hypothetical protein